MAGLSREHGLGLLKSAKFSDYTITCPGKVFKVHKAIISAESQYFDVCCGGDFKEGQESNVDLTDHPMYVQLMLQHLYSGEYRIPTHENFRPTDNENWTGKLPEKVDTELSDIGGPATTDKPSTSSSQNHAASDEPLNTETPNEGHEDHASDSQNRTTHTIAPNTQSSDVVQVDKASDDDNSHTSSDLTDESTPPEGPSREFQYVTKVHMKVFALADFLDMESLKTYATDKIISQVRHALEQKYTIDFGREILTTSPFDNDNEPKLKERFIKTCLDWYIDNDLRPEMMSLFGEREPVALHYARVIKEAKADHNGKGGRRLDWNNLGWGAQLPR